MDEPRVDRPHALWWIAILGGMGLTGALALSATAHAWWEAHVTAWTPRPLLIAIFAAACLEHVRKALVAVREAERAGLQATSLAWGWQTLLLGWPSLRLLRARTRRAA